MVRRQLARITIHPRQINPKRQITQNKNITNTPKTKYLILFHKFYFSHDVSKWLIDDLMCELQPIELDLENKFNE